MITDKRRQLAASLLQLKGDAITEVERRMATATTDAILTDMAILIAGAINKKGPGLPVHGLDGNMRWFSPEKLVACLQMAEADQDEAMVAIFRDCLKAIEKLDENTVFIAITRPDGFRIYPLHLDDPAAGAREVINSFPAVQR